MAPEAMGLSPQDWFVWQNPPSSKLLELPQGSLIGVALAQRGQGCPSARPSPRAELGGPAAAGPRSHHMLSTDA